MRVLVCGSRHWTDQEALIERLCELPPSSHIIEGGAPGADTMAKQFAYNIGWPCTEVNADWEKYGKAAGPIRNRQMLDMKPDLVIAFHKDISKSKGTRDTIEEAKKRGIPVELIT